MSETQYRQEDVEYVEAEVVTPDPIRVPESAPVFTSEDFEGALDKASRTVKELELEDAEDTADALEALQEKGEVTWEEVKDKQGL